MKTSLIVIALVLAVGYTNATKATFHGATREKSMRGNLAKADGGKLIIWFTPTTDIAIGSSIYVESDTAIAQAAATTACTITSNDGDGTAESAGGADTAWTSTKIFKFKTKTAKILANKVVSISCADAQMKTTGPAAGTAVKFKVKTTEDTDDSDQVLGYTQTHNTDLTATVAKAARTKSLATGKAGGDLVFTFTPTTETAANAKIKIKSSKKIWTADDATSTSCTVDQMTPSTNKMKTVSVSSTTTSGTGTEALIATGAKLIAGLPVKVWCDGTKNVEVNVAGENKFQISTVADTAATADSAAGCPITNSAANTIGTGVTKVTATRSGSRATSATAADAGDLVVTFTPTTALATGDTITIAADTGIFTTAGTTADITATGNNPSAALTVTSDGDTKVLAETAANVALGTAAMKNVIQVKVGAAATVHPVAVKIPKSKLSANPATETVVRFSVFTSKDKGTLLNALGYIVQTQADITADLKLGQAASSSSAAAAAKAAAGDGSKAAAAKGASTEVVQDLTFADLDATTYKDNVKATYECAYVQGMKADFCTAAEKKITLKTGVTCDSKAVKARRKAKVTFTAGVQTSLMTKAQLETAVAAGIDADKFKAKFDAVNTATKYAVAAPGVITVSKAAFKAVAAPKAGAKKAAASAGAVVPSLLAGLSVGLALFV